MRLYYTKTSPYARVVRMLVIEKGLSDRVEAIEAKTRTPGSPYYQLNPSGRVPFLDTGTGLALEDSLLIAQYLDTLGGEPRLTLPLAHQNWAYGRLETYTRSFVDGLAVHIREMRRPETERSPTILQHEKDRALRLADFWEREIGHPLMQGPLNMAQMLLIAGLDHDGAKRIADLEGGRPRLAAWAGRMRLRESVRATGPAVG